MKAVAARKVLVWLSLVMVGLLFTGLSYARIDLETAVGIWLFDDEDDVAEDISGKGNDGALIGGPKWTEGKFGKALEFDGADDYVNCGFADSLAMTDEITVMFWFKTDKKMSVFEDRQAVVGKHYLEYEVGIYPNGGVHTYTNDGTGGGYDEGINCSITGKLPDGDADWVLDKWYHMAWTLEEQHEIVYVNGIKIGEFNKPHAGTKAQNHTLEIGRRVGGSLIFTGAVDEVAVFNAVLEQEDIEDVVQRGLEAALRMVAVFPADRLASTWATIKTQ